MIKFFRKIRQKLVNENKTSKYFKYAIGEIILVVIGILIALSINTWNENRKSELEANFQLSKLRDNLISDKRQIEMAIAEDSVYIKNLVFCVNVLSNEKKVSFEEFSSRFQNMANTVNFSPIRGTFDGLVSSGKIELIKNQNLLDVLFTYYNSDSYNQWDSALKDYSRTILMPYILNFDHIPNDTVEKSSRFTQFDISKFSVPRKTIDDYKNNLFLLNGLRMKIQLFEGQRMVYLELHKEIDSLIDKIDNELNYD